MTRAVKFMTLHVFIQGSYRGTTISSSRIIFVVFYFHFLFVVIIIPRFK